MTTSPQRPALGRKLSTINRGKDGKFVPDPLTPPITPSSPDAESRTRPLSLTPQPATPSVTNGVPLRARPQSLGADWNDAEATARTEKRMSKMQLPPTPSPTPPARVLLPTMTPKTPTTPSPVSAIPAPIDTSIPLQTLDPLETPSPLEIKTLDFPTPPQQVPSSSSPTSRSPTSPTSPTAPTASQARQSAISAAPPSAAIRSFQSRFKSRLSSQALTRPSPPSMYAKSRYAPSIAPSVVYQRNFSDPEYRSYPRNHDDDNFEYIYTRGPDRSRFAKWWDTWHCGC